MEKQPDPMQIVCALPKGDQAQRRVEIQNLLESRASFVCQVDGVEVQWAFSVETVRGLLDFILFERTCCSTFTYELRFAPPHTAVSLRVRASTGQVEMLQALYRSLTDDQVYLS
jgi:hypothetical protein